MRTLSSELATAIANDDGIKPALRATVYKSRNFFEATDIEDTYEASFGQDAGLQTNPLPQDVAFNESLGELFTVYNHGGNIKLTASSQTEFTPTYSASPLSTSGSSRPAIITSGSDAYIYFFDDGGDLKRAVADANDIASGTAACITSLDTITSGSYGAVHAMDIDDIAVFNVDEGGVSVARWYYSGSWLSNTFVRRFCYPTHIYKTLVDTAGVNFSAAVKRTIDVSTDEWLFYFSMYDGSVQGVCLSDDGSWGDIFEAIPSDISTFKIANAEISPNGMVHLVGQFQRVDIIDRDENDVLISIDERLADSTSYFTSTVVHCLDLWSEEGRTFSLDRFTMITTEDTDLGGTAQALRYMTSYDTSGSGADSVMYSDANRVLQGTASYDISHEDADSLSIPLGDITSINGSPTSGWSIIVKNGDEKYSNEALMQKGSCIVVEVGAMLADDYEYVVLDTCIIAGVDKESADAKRTLNVRAMSTTLWKVSVMTHPFYMEFESKQSMYISDPGDEDQWSNMYEATESGKIPFTFVVDFWNSSEGSLNTHEDSTETIHETQDFVDGLGWPEYPVITELPLTIKLYGWSRAGQSTVIDPLDSGFPAGEGSEDGWNDEFTATISVMHDDETEETFAIDNLTSTYKNPEQTFNKTRSGDYPVIHSATVSDGLVVGDIVKKVGFTVTSGSSGDHTTYVVERMEIPELTMYVRTLDEDWVEDEGTACDLTGLRTWWLGDPFYAEHDNLPSSPSNIWDSPSQYWFTIPSNNTNYMEFKVVRDLWTYGSGDVNFREDVLRPGGGGDYIELGNTKSHPYFRYNPTDSFSWTAAERIAMIGLANNYTAGTITSQAGPHDVASYAWAQNGTAGGDVGAWIYPLYRGIPGPNYSEVFEGDLYSYDDQVSHLAYKNATSPNNLYSDAATAYLNGVSGQSTYIDSTIEIEVQLTGIFVEGHVASGSGTLYIDLSNDAETWTEYTDLTFTGSWTIQSDLLDSDTKYRYIRLRWSGTAGSQLAIDWFQIRHDSGLNCYAVTRRKLMKYGTPAIMFAFKPFRAFNFQAQGKFELSGSIGVAYGGVVGLASDSLNYIVGRVSLTGCELVKVRDGVETVLDTASVSKTGNVREILMEHRNGVFRVWIRIGPSEAWSETPDITYEWKETDGQLAVSDDILHVGLYGFKDVPMLRICSFDPGNTEYLGVLPLGDDDFGDFPSSGQVMINGSVHDYTGKITPPDPIEGPYQCRNTGLDWDYTSDGIDYNGNAVEFTRFEWVDNSTNYTRFDGKIMASSNGHAWLMSDTDFHAFTITTKVYVYLKNRGRFFGDEVRGNFVGWNQKIWITGGLSGVTLAEESTSQLHSEGDIAYLSSDADVLLLSFAASSGHEDMTVEDIVDKITQLAGGKAVFPGDAEDDSQLLTTSEWTVV